MKRHGYVAGFALVVIVVGALVAGSAGAQAQHPINVTGEGEDQALGSGYSMTVLVETGSIAGLSVLNFSDPLVDMCSSIEREFVSGSGGLAHCPGDDLDPNPNGPPAIYCFSAPCELRITSETKLNFYAIHGPTAFGATPWTGSIIAWDVFGTGATTVPPTTSTTPPPEPVPEPLDWRETSWADLVPLGFIALNLLLFGSGFRVGSA